MRRLILQEWMSLDGYAVDERGTLDFFPASEVDQFSDRDQLEFLESVDTILLGRRTYELFVDFWPTATTDKEIIADRLNAQAGNPMVVWGGLSLAQSLIAAEPIDEYPVPPSPTLVGGGRPLFPSL